MQISRLGAEVAIIDSGGDGATNEAARVSKNLGVINSRQLKIGV
jgi:hypothetical protein